MTAWAWVVAKAVPLLATAVLALAVFVGMRSCRENDQSIDAAVMAERIRVDSLRAIGDSIALAETRRQLDMALANGVKVVDRWRDAAPRPIPVGSSSDSVRHLTQQVRQCRDAGDSLVKSVVVIQSTCTAFRDTATKTISNLRTIVARQDSLYKIGKPPKRWGLGIFAGYGARLDSATLKHGYVVGVGVTYSLFQF